MSDKKKLALKVLSPETEQTTQLVSYIDAFASKDIIEHIFDCLNVVFVPSMLEKLVQKFGFCEEIIASSFSSFQALNYIAHKLKDKNKFDLLSKDLSSDEDQIKNLLKIIKHKNWHDSEVEIMAILSAFGDTMKDTYGGLAAVEIIKYAINFEDTLRFVTDNDYWPLLSKMFLSQREEVVTMAYDVVMKLEIPKEYVNTLFESTVLCFFRTKNEKIFNFIVTMINKQKGIPVTKFISVCLASFGHSQKKDFKVIKTLLKLNLENHTLPFDSEFSTHFAKALRTRNPNIQLALGLFLLKNFQISKSFNFIVKPILDFLYQKEPPFVVATPYLEVLMKLAEDDEIIKLLVNYNFVLYLHNVPLLYPREENLPILSSSSQKHLEKSLESQHKHYY